jgi:hypothetical protein
LVSTMKFLPGSASSGIASIHSRRTKTSSGWRSRPYAFMMMAPSGDMIVKSMMIVNWTDARSAVGSGSGRFYRQIPRMRVLISSFGPLAGRASCSDRPCHPLQQTE